MKEMEKRLNKEDLTSSLNLIIT